SSTGHGLLAGPVCPRRSGPSKREGPSPRPSFLVDPDTDLDVLLIEDSFAYALVVTQESSQRRVRANMGARTQLGRLLPFAELILRFPLNVLAITEIYSGEIAIAKLAREERADLGELPLPFGIELVQFRHCSGSHYSFGGGIAFAASPKAKPALGRHGSM